MVWNLRALAGKNMSWTDFLCLWLSFKELHSFLYHPLSPEKLPAFSTAYLWRVAIYAMLKFWLFILWKFQTKLNDETHLLAPMPFLWSQGSHKTVKGLMAHPVYDLSVNICKDYFYSLIKFHHGTNQNKTNIPYRTIIWRVMSMSQIRFFILNFSLHCHHDQSTATQKIKVFPAVTLKLFKL
jgi:hypothetical protein